MSAYYSVEKEGKVYHVFNAASGSENKVLTQPIAPLIGAKIVSSKLNGSNLLKSLIYAP